MLCDYTEFWSGWESVVPVARRGKLSDRWGRIRTNWTLSRHAGTIKNKLVPMKTIFFLTLCHRAIPTPGLGLGKAEKGDYGNWTSFGLTSAPYKNGRQQLSISDWCSPRDFDRSMATVLLLPAAFWANFSCDPTLTWNSEKRSSSSANWTQYKSPLRVACFGGKG